MSVNLTSYVANALGLSGQVDSSAIMGRLAELSANQDLVTSFGQDRFEALQDSFREGSLSPNMDLLSRLAAVHQAQFFRHVQAVIPGVRSMIRANDGQFHRFGEGLGVRPVKRVYIANRSVAAMSAINYLKAIREEYGVPIEIVVPYIPEDKDEVWVKAADKVVPLERRPGEDTSKIFQDPERNVAAALSMKCDSVVVMWGFAAEDPAYAKAFEDNKMLFVGPPPQVTEAYGHKWNAVKAAEAAGLPVSVHTQDCFNAKTGSVDIEEVRRQAIALGFPNKWLVMKKVDGGGGYGNQILKTEEDFNQWVNRFIQDKCEFYLEEFFGQPGSDIVEKRHIEFQIIAAKGPDGKVKAKCVGFRDCSSQYRDKKQIESTTTGVPLEEILSMYEAVERFAEAQGYVAAGTFEFMFGRVKNKLDEDKQERWEKRFLEVNTRLQVEHTITDQACGISLFKHKLLAAMGYPLQLIDTDCVQKYATLQARILAKDGRMKPAAGKIARAIYPDGKDVFVYPGAGDGSMILTDADDMFAEIVVRAPLPTYDPRDAKSYAAAMAVAHEEARKRLKEALKKMRVLGIKTNIPLLLELLDRPEFIHNEVDTGLVAKMLAEGLDADLLTDTELGQALLFAAATFYKDDEREAEMALRENPNTLISRQDVPRPRERNYQLVAQGKKYEISVGRHDAEHLMVTVNGETRLVSSSWLLTTHQMTVDDQSLSVSVALRGEELQIAFDGGKNISVKKYQESGAQTNFPQKLELPAGDVVDVLVKAGDVVQEGQPIAIIKAMKQDNVIQASVSGRVTKVNIAAAGKVVKDQVLMVIEKQQAGEKKDEISLGTSGRDFSLPSAKSQDWLSAIAKAEDDNLSQLSYDLIAQPAALLPDLFRLIENYFLGYDISAEVARKAFKVFSTALSELPEPETLFSNHLNRLLGIFSLSKELSEPAHQRALLSFYHHLDRPDLFECDDVSARKIISLLQQHGVKLAQGESALEQLRATVSQQGSRHYIAKILLHASELIHWGMDRAQSAFSRSTEIQEWVALAPKFGDASLGDSLRKVAESEDVRSPLRKAALKALKVVNPRVFHELYPAPVEDPYVETYNRLRDNPHDGLSPDQVSRLRSSLKNPFQETPFDDLPRAFVDVEELKNHYSKFHVRRLADVVSNTAVYEIVPKDPAFKGDKRFITVSWVNKPVKFERDAEDRITGVPVLESAYVDSIRSLVAYTAFDTATDKHQANRPILFALGQAEAFQVDAEDDPTQFSKVVVHNIGKKLYRFGPLAGSFSLRTIMDTNRGREIVRHSLSGHTLKTSMNALSREVVAEPRSKSEIEDIKQISKGKMIVDDRLDTFFGKGAWEELRLEDQGYDKPGVPSGVKIGVATYRGEKVCFFASDFRLTGGSVSKAVGEKMAWINRHAEAIGAKAVVRLFDSGGAMVDEGVPALDGAASTMNSTVMIRKKIPQVTAIVGPCAGMSAYDPSISEGPIGIFEGDNPDDSVGFMFLTGPDVVEEVLSVKLTKSELGGARSHVQETGVADARFKTEKDLYDWMKVYLDFVMNLPVEGQRETPKELEGLVDPNSFIELKSEYATVVTGFARVNGQRVGVIRNSPYEHEHMRYEDMREVDDFVRLCRNLGIPMIKDQPSPWYFGDPIGEGLQARWADRVDRRFHEFKSENRGAQYSILRVNNGHAFDEGHVNASSDFIIAVVGKNADEINRAKAKSYAHFVVDSEVEAYRLISRLESLWNLRRQVSVDAPNRDTESLLRWAIPTKPGESYDVRKLIQGASKFKVTKVVEPSNLDNLFKAMVGDVPSRLIVTPEGKIEGVPFTVNASEAESQEETAYSEMLNARYQYRVYKTPDGMIAVQFSVENMSLSGLYDKESTFEEYMKDFAPNVVTGWTYLNGELVGVIANQPQSLAGVADKNSAEKIESFKRFCNSRGIKMTNLIYMPGFQPGDEEIIDIGGQLLIAEVEFEQAQASLVLGLDTGGGYIERASRFIRGITIHLDGGIQVFLPYNYIAATEFSKILVMGAEGAVKIVKEYKTAIQAAAEADRPRVRAEIIRRFNREVGDPYRALQNGSVDAVVSLGSGRSRLISGLADSAARIEMGRRYQQLRGLLKDPLLGPVAQQGINILLPNILRVSPSPLVTGLLQSQEVARS